MPGDIIKAFLEQDIISISPETVSMNNSTFWPASSDVPDYAYKCLKDIYVGASASTSEYNSRIVADFGQAKESAKGDITIFCSPRESVLGGSSGDIIFSDEFGAESCNVQIVFTRPQNATNRSIMENAELRVRYLLDYYWRQKRRVSPVIPNTTNNSIDDYLQCFFVKYDSSFDTQQFGVTFRVYYTRLVPR